MRVPVKQSFLGEYFTELLRRVEHHLDDTVDISVFVLLQSCNIEAELPRDRRTDTPRVEYHPSMALDFMVSSVSTFRVAVHCDANP